jgi:hypothetical protein
MMSVALPVPPRSLVTGTKAVLSRAPTMIPEIGFALDSPLEEGGFEPSVPLSKTPRLRPRSNRINLRT